MGLRTQTGWVFAYSTLKIIYVFIYIFYKIPTLQISITTELHYYLNGVDLS